MRWMLSRKESRGKIVNEDWLLGGALDDESRVAGREVALGAVADDGLLAVLETEAEARCPA